VKYRVTIGSTELEVEADETATGPGKVLVSGRDVTVGPGGPRGDDAEKVICTLGSERVEVTLLPSGTASGGELRLLVRGRIVLAKVESERDRLRAMARRPQARSGMITARSTLPGIIRRVFASPGDKVDEGTPLLTLEAMKMENEVRAEATGSVRSILVKEGQVVNAGDALAEIDPA
jgi:biotin carboxyl carrier protein